MLPASCGINELKGQNSKLSVCGRPALLRHIFSQSCSRLAHVMPIGPILKPSSISMENVKQSWEHPLISKREAKTEEKHIFLDSLK